MEPALRRPTGGFATRAVHGAANVPNIGQRPVAAPIWPAAMWATDDSNDVADLLTDALPGYVYGRYDNPTATTLHTVIASLHEAPAAWSFASGTAALHAVLEVLRGDGRILASSRLYGGTWALLRRLEREAGWKVDHAELTGAADLDAALRPGHTVVHVETIANPSVAVVDVPDMAARCRDRGVALVVDNTFASPYLARPIQWGATAVVESATKYLGGHGDVVAGVAAGSETLISDIREHAIELGGCLGPFEAWLVLRGVQTLPLRMRQASSSAKEVAQALADDPRVLVVRYPGLETDPQHELAARLFERRGAGGVLSFDLGTRDAARRFADACAVFVRAVSLGATHSLVLHPASTSHRQLDDRALAAAGLGPGTIRLAVGIEDEQDLVADVRAALDAAVPSEGSRS